MPSIWVENSPLVIHEALQARIPVITANTGGMAEDVHHEQNGLLFTHRSPQSLAEQMRRFIANPIEASQLGQRGYLYADDGNIPEMGSHVQELETYYAQLIARKRSQNITSSQIVRQAHGGLLSIPTLTTATSTALCAKSILHIAPSNESALPQDDLNDEWISLLFAGYWKNQ